jgi:hypothetical protein
LAGTLAAVLATAGCPPGAGDGGDSDRSGEFQPGAASAGDPYLPAAGNRGYQVGHYHLEVRYDPSDKASYTLAVG